jgi:hypothetical protein
MAILTWVNLNIPVESVGITVCPHHQPAYQHNIADEENPAQKPRPGEEEMYDKYRRE